MLSPDYLYNVSDRAVELYEQLNTFVIKDICRRLVGADFQLTGSADWQLYKLQQSGMLMDDIVTQVAQLTKKSQNEVKDIFEQATYKSQAYDNSVYKAAGLKPIDITQSPAMLQILQATYNQTMGSLYNFTQTTANQTQAEFISTMDDISMRVLYGQQSYTSAISHAIRDLASTGMRVSYPSGRTLSLENAVRTAVMTGVGQATAKLSIANCEELDTDLVVVSSHPGARPSHQEWQGKVYSISGTNPKYQKLSEATGYGSVTGLCGANCRHHFSPFIEGVSTNPYEDYNDEENKERYENQQEQRRMERDIRNNKRYLEALQESIDTTSDEKLKFALQQDYDRASAQLQEQRAAYSVYSKEHGLQLQQDRLQTAGWGRKEASRSTAAAKRYYDSIEPYENVNTFRLGIGESGGRGGQGEPGRVLGQINPEDKDKLFDIFREQIRDADVENAIVVDRFGTVTHFVGTKDSVVIKDVELDGAHILHNHPASEGILSFGKDDFDFLRNNQVASLEATNAEFDYYVRPLKAMNNLSYNRLYLEALGMPDADKHHNVFLQLKDKGYVEYDRRPKKKD